MRENILTLLVYLIILTPFAITAWGLFQLTKPMFPSEIKK